MGKCLADTQQACERLEVEACNCSCHGFFGCPFSFIYTTDSYNCCSCWSWNTKVEKKRTQEHKKLRNSSHKGKRLGKICHFQHGVRKSNFF